ncbi:hypoxia induced protein conserved region-domain-containing protein [Corynascus novoguineensis]|uniref:Hypoxia induced protein conserved region-domain-containing protein n=1 Tax=Corynascus novoguineensis TaxID=1126955 RepID=A0AAN7CQH4_9PEZI|nr:hypoxia induced protein conserved region-domain-containing protein [Corynascus novoguineensis]
MSDRPLSGRPLPSSFDDNEDFYNESGFQKALRKLKEEPLIPIGCMLTVAAFTNAYRAMKRGDHHGVQRMFRARVAAQGFTVLAMVAGGFYYAEDRNKQKELWKLKQQREAEEKRQKWIKELEARDEEERALQEMMDKKRKRAAERAARSETRSEGVAAQARAALKESKAVKDEGGDAGTTETPGQQADGEKSNSGVLGSLGGWFGGSRKAPENLGKETKD